MRIRYQTGLLLLSRRQVLTLAAAVAWVILAACGTEPEGPAAAPTPDPPLEILVNREEATEIALVKIREGWGEGRPGPASELRDITIRFMTVAEYEQIETGSGWYSGPGYGAAGSIWVIQTRADSTHTEADRDGIFKSYRYAIEAVNATTGLFSASARTVSEPFFISSEYDPDVYELDFPADPSTPTQITRSDARNIILDTYDANSFGRGINLFNRMEIELVHSAERGLLWWVFIPSQLSTRGCGGAPPLNDDRRLMCWAFAVWQFIDAETGAIYQGQNFGKTGPRVTSEESQALFRFAQAEGWWELWHRLKPYTEQSLPEGLAESLDRPDAPTPTPRPPTPTPDPNAPPPPPPTPTPAPEATPAQNNTRPTATPAPTASPEDLLPDAQAAFYVAESFAAGPEEVAMDPAVTNILVGTALGIQSRVQMEGTNGRLEAKYAFWVIEVRDEIVNPEMTGQVGIWLRERYIGDTNTSLPSANALQPDISYVFFLMDTLGPPDTSSGVPVLPDELLPLPINNGRVTFNDSEYDLEDLIEVIRAAAANSGRPVFPQ